MLRGFCTIKIDNNIINLQDYTEKFQLFACSTTKIEVASICIVENLDTFLVAEKLLGKKFVFLHKYGRIGKEAISILHAKGVLVFVDYGFNGLEEFLRIQEIVDHAKLYIPENYEELFAKYSKSLTNNKAQITNKV